MERNNVSKLMSVFKLLAFSVNKLVSNKVSKDRSFQRYLVLDILTNRDRVRVTFWEKNPLPISPFTYISLKIKFVPFLKSSPATIPCKRKTIKVGNKTAYKKEGQRKKENKGGTRGRVQAVHTPPP